ncbi:unnamed protein product [Diamesa serratosioi]
MSRSCESTNCIHLLELDFMNDKYRDVLNQLKHVSNDFNTLKEDYNSRINNDSGGIKYLKLCEELTKERNDLKQQLSETEFEVTQVLSERGTVLKENQKLSDKNDKLKNELDKVLKSRDDYVKECESIKQKMELIRNRTEFMPSNEDLFQREENKMTFLSLEVANQEIEKLKKLLEKVKSEVSKAIQESEIAKGRRDWAMSEREKIVQERDSMRNLCDELRKERDTATSKLLAAIRDKDEAFKKIEQLNEKLEALTNAKKAAENHEITNNNSNSRKTSHSDGEEEIEVDVTHMLVNADLGITLDCGNEDSDYNGNNLYPQVIYIEPDSIFYGKLQANDVIHCINGIDCSTLSKRMLFKTIRTSAPTCKMLLKRNKTFTNGVGSMENSFQIVPFVPPTAANTEEIGLLNTSINSSSPNSSKSTSSKISGMLQKIRDKISNSNKDNQENDAIAVLDSVLNSQDSLQEISMKENSKKSKHKKNIAKSWPRAAMVMHDPSKSHSGTMVFNRKKERPRLYPIPTDDGGNSQSKDQLQDQISKEQQKAVNTFFAPPPIASRNSNRNSNPIPNSHVNMMRASAIPPRSTLPSSGSGSIQKNPTYMHTIHEPVKNINMNRLSLNLSNIGPKSHHSFIPIKSSMSIESTTMSKSPIEAKEDALDFNTSQKIKKYFSNYSNNSKYECTSDNENFSSSGVSQNDSLNATSTNTLPSHLRVQSVNRVQAVNYSGVYGMSQSHTSAYLANRYASPPPFPPTSEHGNHHEVNSLHNSHNSSIDYTFTQKMRSQLSREEMTSLHGLGAGSGGAGGSYQESGTFPRKKDVTPRFRPPPPSHQIAVPLSKPVKISNNSIDYCGTPDRSSPMPTFQIQIVKPGRINNVNKRNSMPEYGGMGYKPNIGEKRRVHIDKSEKPLGISIRCRNNRGVFVSHVGEHSIASQVGLQIGDQLLEFCGINMRSATYDLAAKFLRQCGNSITMLVQYNPEKYEELSTSDENVSRSDDSTPQNSPKVTRSVISSDSSQNVRKESSHSTQTLKTQRNPILSTLQQVKSASIVSPSSQMQHMMGSGGNTLGKEQPRVIYIETQKCPNLGVSLLGGNAYGIFIHSVQKDSIADNVGLRVGDQIMEYNGTDLRRATAEYAAFELAKPADKVNAMVQYNIQKFNQIKDKPGDSFYIRVGFDRSLDLNESELSFGKDDVLYVDNTMFRGVSGHWRAWKLDEYGHRLQCGIIPSQMKVEEELRLLGDSADDNSSSRRSSTSARRSFFKRIKPQRGSSRDSKELASFSNTHLSLYLDPAMNEDGTVSYQRVERLEYNYRPVLVIGALSEWVVDKLIIDFPEQFHRCLVNQMKCSKDEIENRLKNNSIIEYRRRGSLFECVSLQAVKDNKLSHCILDVNLSAVERLHRNQIYPIVLLLKFKSAKQIKEIKDSRYSTDKLSAKQAKEMYEHALKLESEYRQYISVVIQGVNITHMSTQIKAAVDVEQKKLLWIPRNS